MSERRTARTAPTTRTRRIALAGNPNVGKSSLFNHLTGAHQHVGNWPGKTVERRAGTCRIDGAEVEIVDLPGTYSLAGLSPEERVAAAALADPELDAVVVVLDTTNLERNLYLAAQVAEIGRPMVLALNMTDTAARDGFVIDDDALSRALGSPVVRTVARSGSGLDELRRALLAAGATLPSMPISSGGDVDAALAELAPAVAALHLEGGADARWLALRLLEEEPVATEQLAAAPGGTRALARAGEAGARIREASGVPAPLLIADRRYSWAHALSAAAVTRETAPRSRTDRLDDVLTHPWLGLPIFLALMWLTFTLVVEVADPFIGWIEELTEGPLTRIGAGLLAAVGLADTWVEGMLLDGLLAGVGGVLVFVPVLAMLYLALGVLEDSGYMSRAAFLMDRIMAPIGLSGRSFLPLLLGFGCNVPAVSATRVLERRRDRIITGLLVPFVSCAARLPVYVLLATIFFTEASGTVVFALYLLSIATVLVLGAVLDRVLLRSQRSGSFILELPAYHRPGARVLGSYVGHRVGAFVTEAGPVIVAGAIGVWFLLAIPVGGDGSFDDTGLDDSAFAATARVVAPSLEPAGLGSWEVTGTLLSGLVAKEIVVTSLWQVFDVEVAQEPEEPEAEDDPTLREDLVEVGAGFLGATRDAALALPTMVGLEFRAEEGEADMTGLAAPLRDGLTTSSGGHPAVAALALMVFVLLYVPCFATIGALRQELGARWALLSVGLSLTVAWLAATMVFQVGRLVAGALGGG